MTQAFSGLHACVAGLPRRHAHPAVHRILLCPGNRSGRRASAWGRARGLAASYLPCDSTPPRYAPPTHISLGASMTSQTSRPWARRLAGGTVLLLAAAGCQPTDVSITNRAQIVQSVYAQLTVWTRAMNNRSVDTLARLYRQEPNLTALWPDGERTRGWSGWAAKWQRWDS